MKHALTKQVSWILLSLVVIGTSFGVGFSTGLRSHPEIEKVDSLENKEGGKPPKVDFSAFWKTWNVLNEKYVSPATTTTLSERDRVWGAIEGLASSYKDPYTVFFSPESNKIFTSEIAGNFEGVGMEVGTKEGTITVIAPLKDTPAQKAGILPGDRILKIDDMVTSGMKVEEAIKRIRGKKGTIVKFNILHDGKKDSVEISVTRDTIAIPTIDTEVKSTPIGKSGTTTSSTGLQDNGIFVIKLYSFSQNSPDLFRNALRKFVESGSDKLILDLRGNPGGYLEAAVDMVSWFLPAGEVVVSEDFGKNKPSIIYRSHYKKVFNGNLKFVILVNGGSASASEIMAGALQEYGIAKIVGTTTFGKGVVQELVSITPDTSLKVTVARWLTPKGNSISAKGVTPDVEVKITAEDIAKGNDLQMNAAVKLLTK
ncbi:MAG: S41 family peptidase [Candidatus Taylorbacteria bacterium]|nr:S41 family peptidase [Candidatus Taylorbacteria bacterium]